MNGSAHFDIYRLGVRYLLDSSASLGFPETIIVFNRSSGSIALVTAFALLASSPLLPVPEQLVLSLIVLHGIRVVHMVVFTYRHEGPVGQALIDSGTGFPATVEGTGSLIPAHVAIVGARQFLGLFVRCKDAGAPVWIAITADRLVERQATRVFQVVVFELRRLPTHRLPLLLLLLWL